MIKNKALVGAALLAAAFAAPAQAIELQHATLDAWRHYVDAADARMQSRPESGKPFLWIDEAPDRAARVRRGEVLVAPAIGRGTQSVPNGLIHDWIGAVFIPNAGLGTLMEVVHNYNRYKEIYRPVVTDSRVIDGGADEQQFAMVWQRHVLFVNAAMRGRYKAHDFTLDARRGYSFIDATSIQEIEEYGQPSQHLLPPDTGNGFIWRVHSIARYEERDGGVYLEMEAMALTRDIPGSLRWLVSPVVNHLSVNSLTMTLSQTREAVGAEEITFAMRESKGQN